MTTITIDSLRPGQVYSAFFAETRHREDIVILSPVRYLYDDIGTEIAVVDVRFGDEGGEEGTWAVDDLVRMSLILASDPDWPIYQGAAMVPGLVLSRYLERTGTTLRFTVKGLVRDPYLADPQVELIGETFDIIATVAELRKMNLVVGDPRPVVVTVRPWTRRPDDDGPTRRPDGRSFEDIPF